MVSIISEYLHMKKYLIILLALVIAIPQISLADGGSSGGGGSDGNVASRPDMEIAQVVID